MNLANQITFLRIVLIPVFISSLIYYSPDRPGLLKVSILCFIAACVTDALDGYVARRFNQKTQLGSYIDPIADKLLLLTAFASLSFMNNLPPSMKIPAWVTFAVFTRDILILVGSAIIFIMTGRLKAEPLFIGKFTTVVQMGTLFAALVSAPYEVRAAFYMMTLALTAASSVLYFRMGSRILQGSAGVKES